MNLKWPDVELSSLGRRQAAAALLCGGPILVCLQQPAERESERVTPTLPREREREKLRFGLVRTRLFLCYIYIIYALLLNLSKYFQVKCKFDK